MPDTIFTLTAQDEIDMLGEIEAAQPVEDFTPEVVQTVVQIALGIVEVSENV